MNEQLLSSIKLRNQETTITDINGNKHVEQYDRDTWVDILGSVNHYMLMMMYSMDWTNILW